MFKCQKTEVNYRQFRKDTL